MNTKLVTVDNFRDVENAHIAKAKLESEGIFCVLHDEKNIGYTEYSVAYGGVKLKVREEDKEKAKLILNK